MMEDEKIGCISNDVLERNPMYCTDCELTPHFCKIKQEYGNRTYIYEEYNNMITLEDLIEEVKRVRQELKEFKEEILIYVGGD